MNKKIILLVIISIVIMMPTIDILFYEVGKEPIFSQFYSGCPHPPEKMSNGWFCNCAQVSYYDFFYYKLEANEGIRVSPSNYQLRLFGFIIL